MSSECIICKSKSQDLPGVSKEKIFKKYRCHEFWLCYKHSVELFKLGQEQFILKYPTIAQDSDWLNEGEFKKSMSYF